MKNKTLDKFKRKSIQTETVVTTVNILKSQKEALDKLELNLSELLRAHLENILK